MLMIDTPHNKTSFQIAIVTSRFNQDVTKLLFNGAIKRLNELAFPDDQITAVWVPGAVEIPITAQQLAKTGNYSVIICLGAVIRGDTSHYDYVCQQVSHGCQQVALAHNLPVIFGVLTTENEEQAFDRAGGKHGNYGHYAVDAGMEMAAVLYEIKHFNKIN